MLSLKRIRIKSRCFQETPTSRTRNNTSLKVIRWYMTLSYCYCLILNAGQLPIWLFFFFPSQWAIEVVIFLMMFLLKRKKNNGQETPDPITSACQSGSQPFQLLYLVIYLVQFSILLSGLEYSLIKRIHCPAGIMEYRQQLAFSDMLLTINDKQVMSKSGWMGM